MHVQTARVIPAEVVSGNSAIKAKFDAVRWFENARRDDIGALAACGWKGCGDRHLFVEYFLHLDEEVSLVLDYAHRTQTGVRYSVDAHAAMAWITENRPNLHDVLVAIPHLTGNSRPERTAAMRQPNVAILRGTG